ncbi:cell division protein FtsX, partial [Candidatus Latescibacterota bacterium]
MNSFSEAIKGMLGARYMTLISIVTIAVTLIGFGVFGIVTVFAHKLVYQVKKSEEINVYLKETMSDEDMLALDAAIRSMKEIMSTRIISKEDAAEEFKNIFGGNLLTAIDENPLPRTIVVIMAERYRMSDDMETVADRIVKVEGVESVEYGKEWMSKMDIFFMIFLAIETVLTVLIVTACILVISNTISLTVLARRETIEIMRLVGATDSFIRRPFYVEGLLQGLISGIISFGVIYGAFFWTLNSFPDLDAYLYMFRITGFPALSYVWVIALIIPFGGLMGLFSYVPQNPDIFSGKNRK